MILGTEQTPKQPPKQPEAPTSIELARLEKDKNFRIHGRMGICAILQKIMHKHTLVTLYLDQGNRFILTSLLAIDSGQNEVVMDYGIDEALNQSALSAKRLTFITSQDRIKIEFVCTTIRKIEFEGRNAFAVNLPESLVRMQRRGYFRITTPTINPLTCIIPLLSGHKPATTAEITLLDISCGGIAVIDHHPLVNFDPGTMFKNCQITLGSMGVATVTIQVKNTFAATLRSGLTCKRAGCEFITLPMRMSAMIQRYVVKLEQMAV